MTSGGVAGPGRSPRGRSRAGGGRRNPTAARRLSRQSRGGRREAPPAALHALLPAVSPSQHPAGGSSRVGRGEAPALGRGGGKAAGQPAEPTGAGGAALPPRSPGGGRPGEGCLQKPGGGRRRGACTQAEWLHFRTSGGVFTCLLSQVAQTPAIRLPSLSALCPPAPSCVGSGPPPRAAGVGFSGTEAGFWLYVFFFFFFKPGEEALGRG